MCRDDVRKRTEAFQEKACRLDGKARRSGKRCFSGMGSGPGESLRICGAIASRWLLPPQGQSAQPPSCIRGVVGPEDCNTEISDGQPETSDCLLADWTLSKARSLHEQVGPTRSLAQPTDLQPQPSLEERALQIEDAFSLDDRTRPNDVITNGKAFPDHSHTELFEAFRYPRQEFVHIGCHNDHMDQCRVRRAEERDDFENSAPTSHFAKAKWQ
jgi:hypothetical protein